MNPLRKFKNWYKDAKNGYTFDHTAFNLSTSYKNKPYSRMVLLKKILPSNKGISPKIAFMAVDFPAPLGPTIEAI